MSEAKAIHQISAQVGVWGIKTSELGGTAKLLDFAARLFGIANTGKAVSMAAEIAALGKKERKRRVQKNIVAVSGGPLWDHRAEFKAKQKAATAKRQDDLVLKDNEIVRLKAEANHLQSLNKDAHAVIDRIWAIFGNPSYEELNGRAIYDLVQEAVDALKREKS